MIDITYFEAIALLGFSPLVMYYAYWKGFNNGRRAGYHAGRSIARAAVRNDS